MSCANAPALAERIIRHPDDNAVAGVAKAPKFGSEIV